MKRILKEIKRLGGSSDQDWNMQRHYEDSEMKARRARRAQRKERRRKSVGVARGWRVGRYATDVAESRRREEVVKAGGSCRVVQ